MSSRSTISLIDDLTGEPADETIPFGLDGTNFVIDLSAQNAKILRELLAPYLDVASRVKRGAPPLRPTRPRRPVEPAPSPAGTQVDWVKGDRAAIINFARAHDLKVPADRGRISGDVLHAWEAAGRPS